MGGEIAERRSQMGRSVGGWTVGTPGTHEVGEDYWIMLTGAPSADVNMALLYENRPESLTRTIEAIDKVGAPTLLMFAGDGLALTDELGDPWHPIGTMPMMSISLDPAGASSDDRVRRAGPDDVDAITGLIADSFGLSSEVAVLVASPIRDADPVLTVWVLVDEGEAVSTVSSARVGDAVTLWCMATPERFARRGYARALLADVLTRAADDGARIGLLGATPAGKPLYDATGWKTLEDWHLYLNR